MNKQNRRRLKEIATDLRTLSVVSPHTAEVVARSLLRLDALLKEHEHHVTHPAGRY